MEKINRHTIFTTTILWLLCALFIVQIANRTVYFHSHKLADGTVISHAHPYNKSSDSAPYKKHHHTNFQFTFFVQLEVLFFVTILSFVLYAISKKYVYINTELQCYFSGFLSKKPGRSPPVYS